MPLKSFPLTCSLLIGILLTGCGQQASDKSTKTPTLADSFQGKRIHFQIQDQESERKEEFWLQLGENNQLTVNDHGRNMSMSYVINDTKLIVDADGEAVEMRFSKVKLAVGDEVLFLEHKDGDLQALLDSTDDSAAKRTAPGSITKIEAAQKIVATDPPERPAPENPNGETGPVDTGGTEAAGEAPPQDK